MKDNRNAYIGRGVERLIEDSIMSHLSVIDGIKRKFKIEGDIKNTSGGGVYGDKSDIRLNFICGRYVDVNIKGFSAGFNQLVIMSN